MAVPGSVYSNDPGMVEGDYYYSDRQRHSLVADDNWVAVRLSASDPGGIAAKLPQAMDFTARQELAPSRLILVPTSESLTPESRLELLGELARIPEITLAVPVYRTVDARMVVTDEFIARFAAGTSTARVNAIIRRQQTETVRKLEFGDNTWLLRVKSGSALDTANTFHQLPEVEFAHPDFVRILPPRPADIGAVEGRLILAPDDSILPPDTVIEDGRHDLRVSEPAHHVLPAQSSGLGSTQAVSPVDRTTLKSEGFEGAFPGDWTMYGTPTWDTTAYRAYDGSFSAYCSGSHIAPPGPYHANANSWMVSGPHSLADAVDARLVLQAWIETEVNDDFLFLGASLNGTNFWGMSRSGAWALNHGGDGWMNIALDLKRVHTLGDLTGEDEVWVGVKFGSDGSQAYEGVYVDNVVFEKITGGYNDLTSDEFDHLQWSLDNNQQLWGVDGADIQAADAWGVTHGSDDVIIAILDVGVDLAHPDLASKLVPGYDATGLGSAGAPSGDDAHGTTCAGLAAAVTDNALGVAGVAREARLMPIRLFYSLEGGGLAGTDSGIAGAIDWAVNNGADVLSNSWGGGSPSSLITTAIDNARQNGRGGLGTLVVFASGNDNTAVSYPASLSTTLTVGASSPCDEPKEPTSCDGEFWWGANHGPEMHLVAPGVNNYTTDISGSAGYDPGDYHYNFNGTSSSTPIVAGVAGLLLGHSPGLTADEVEARLMATADDLSVPGWDQRTGFGRVNAYRALTEALPACYPLTTDHTGLGNNPAPWPPSSPGCDPSHFFAGEPVTLTASPAPGWIVSGWAGTDDNGSTASTNSFEMPAAPHTVLVHYEQIPCYALSLSHSGSGADPEPDPASSPGCDAGDYHAGQSIELQADPAPGWAIGGWSGTANDASYEPWNEVVMPSSAHAASVQYVDVPGGCYLLHREHTGLGADPVPTPWNSPGCPGSTYNAGEVVLLEASADPDWTVGSWTGTGYDGSFLWVNSVQMPAHEHTVTAHYMTPTAIDSVRPGPVGAFNRSNWTIVDYTIPAAVGSTLFFAGNDGEHGMELWKSDGTAGGTVMVKDINPGSASAFPWSTSDTFFTQTFVNVNGMLFFIANDGTHGYEVWKSDGTEAGTVMVKNIYVGWQELPAKLTAVGSTLYFTHSDGEHGVELWKSDGTEAGTVMVKDIREGSSDSSTTNLAAYGDLLIFRANDGTNGNEAWISDGTEQGTEMLLDINDDGHSNPNYFTEMNGTIYFAADDGEHGSELWKSNGTGGGTEMVKDISPPSGSYNRGSDLNRLTISGGKLFMQATDNLGASIVSGAELWVSDGSGGGTHMVRNIGPGGSDGFPMQLTDVDGKLFFIANDGPSALLANYEPWISDGTEGGTERIAETYPGTNPTNWIPRSMMEIGGTAFFSAYNETDGRELWQTDGTQAGTFMVKDLWPTGSSAPAWLINANGTLFFRASNSTYGTEIWVLRDDSTCKFLGLHHTGQGADPVADPVGSEDCDPGYYEAGEVISLTADPAPDWGIGGWTGTDDDSSTALTNSLTMPDADHALTVHYSPPELIFQSGFEPTDD